MVDGGVVVVVVDGGIVVVVVEGDVVVVVDRSGSSGSVVGSVGLPGPVGPGMVVTTSGSSVVGGDVVLTASTASEPSPPFARDRARRSAEEDDPPVAARLGSVSATVVDGAVAGGEKRSDTPESKRCAGCGRS
ncbi:MAG: hypothetical protein WD691_12545 [Acidimicrobiales bacterium]